MDTLQPARQEFIDLWGQMASQWGINRTMAQIHALLMLAPAPLTAEAIMDELQISRGNVSMNLRDLINWGVIRRTSVPGDRRDFFVCEQDIWTMFHIILRERKKRELDPLVNRLNTCIQSASTTTTPDPEQVLLLKRLQELHRFFLTFHKLFATVLGDDPKKLAQTAQLLEKLL
jgi:DNA-binding transcriptional regulator GbsR (MarR family)